MQLYPSVYHIKILSQKASTGTPVSKCLNLLRKELQFKLWDLTSGEFR